MTEGLAFAPNSIPPVSGDIPLVSMDPAYGRHLRPGEVLQFDYEAYQASADKIAGQPVDLTGLRVKLTPQLPTPGVYEHNAQNDFREISIRAKLNNPTQPRSQRILLHETKHFVDEQNGDLYSAEWNRRLYDIAVKMFKRKRSIGYAALCSMAVLMAPLGGEAVDPDKPYYRINR